MFPLPDERVGEQCVGDARTAAVDRAASRASRS